MSTHAPLELHWLDLERWAAAGVVQRALDVLAPGEHDALSPASPRHRGAAAAQGARNSTSEPSPARLIVRIALRRLLLERLGPVDGRRPLHISSSGKPSLPGGPAFSLAHTATRGLIAIGGQEPIGVDLELMRTVHMADERRRALVRGAARLAGKAADDAGDDALDDTAVLRAWTGIEAVAKASGLGVGGVLEAIGARPARAPAALPPELAAWRVAPLGLPAPMIGAIALARCDLAIPPATELAP